MCNCQANAWRGQLAILCSRIFSHRRSPREAPVTMKTLGEPIIIYVSLRGRVQQSFFVKHAIDSMEIQFLLFLPRVAPLFFYVTEPAGNACSFPLSLTT